MAWLGFGFGFGRSAGASRRQRSYHSRGGVSRVLAGRTGAEPTCVEDVVKDQDFWGLYRVLVVGFGLLGGFCLLMLVTIGMAGGGFDLDVGVVVLALFTLALFLAPLLFWIRFQRQRRLYERLAEEAAIHEIRD